MTDVLTIEQRRYNMSRIGGKDTKFEILVRSWLHRKGFRFRKNDRRYQGTPDIVLPMYNTIVFINGCFWHRHKGCKYSTSPQTNKKFWENKISNTVIRDKKNTSQLRINGWKVLIVWECELSRKFSRETRLRQLVNDITQ